HYRLGLPGSRSRTQSGADELSDECVHSVAVSYPGCYLCLPANAADRPGKEATLRNESGIAATEWCPPQIQRRPRHDKYTDTGREHQTDGSEPDQGNVHRPVPRSVFGIYQKTGGVPALDQKNGHGTADGRIDENPEIEDHD